MPQDNNQAAPADAIDLAPGRVLLERYRIVELIGRGSTGEVYRAHDSSKRRDIALKVMYPRRLSHDGVRKLFLAEAKIACELYHPGIVKPTGVYSDDKLTFLTSELLEGRTLRQLMNERRASRTPFTRQEVFRIINALIDILQYAHLRTVHRNLKPENIWIDTGNRVRIMDFGVASLVRSERPTRKKPPVGTALYIAPEQWKNWHKVDRAADQYALGALAYELLQGKISARKINSIRRRYKKVGKNPLSVIAKMMALNPAGRFDSILLAGEALTKSESNTQSLLASRSLRALAIIAVVAIALFALAQSRHHLLDYWESVRPLTQAEKQALFDDMIERANDVNALDRRLRRARLELESSLRRLRVDIRDTEDRLMRSVVADDKSKLRRRLEQAQTELAQQQELEALVARLVFNDDGLLQLEDKTRQMFVLFEQGKHQQAIDLIAPLQEDLGRRLRLFDAAASYVTARKRLLEARAGWQRFIASAELRVPEDIERRERAFADLEGRVERGELEGIAQQYQQWEQDYRGDLASARKRVDARERYLAQRAATQALEQELSTYLQRNNLRIDATQAASLQQVRAEERARVQREDFDAASASSRRHAQILREYQAAARDAVAEARRKVAEEQARAALARSQQVDSAEKPVAQESPAKTGSRQTTPPASSASPATLGEFAPGMELVEIPAGSFLMGDSDGNGERDEKPVREVAVAAFAVSKTEVTFAQYDRYAELTGKQKPADAGWGRGERPVINVDWNQASDYADWLSQSTGLSFRLASEAEWEYAARAGSDTAFAWGDQASREHANYGNDFCCSGLASGADRWVNTAPVGSFPANRFGVHDMHGNVAEWVLDCWNDNYLDAPGDARPRFSGHCSQRVVRGGSWSSESGNIRSANRNRVDTVKRASYIGFRLVLERPSGSSQ